MTRAPFASIDVGDVFFVPLDDGRAGLCRVLAKSPDSREVRVATSAWIGRGMDASRALRTEPAARAVLRMTFYGAPRFHVFTTVMPLPSRFARLGVLAPSAEDLSLRFTAGAWESCPNILNAQWAWDHDRDGVITQRKTAARERRRDRAKQVVEARERRDVARAKAAKAPPVDAAKAMRDLRAVARRRWFAPWRGSVERELIGLARAIVDSAVTAALARPRTRSSDRRALVAATRAFDRLNVRHHFIGTLEAEAIHEALMALGCACGLAEDDCEAAIDGARDW